MRLKGSGVDQRGLKNWSKTGQLCGNRRTDGLRTFCFYSNRPTQKWSKVGNSFDGKRRKERDSLTVSFAFLHVYHLPAP